MPLDDLSVLESKAPKFRSNDRRAEPGEKHNGADGNPVILA